MSKEDYESSKYYNEKHSEYQSRFEAYIRSQLVEETLYVLKNMKAQNTTGESSQLTKPSVNSFEDRNQVHHDFFENISEDRENKSEELL